MCNVLNAWMCTIGAVGRKEKLHEKWRDSSGSEKEWRDRFTLTQGVVLRKTPAHWVSYSNKACRTESWGLEYVRSYSQSAGVCVPINPRVFQILLGTPVYTMNELESISSEQI